MKNQVLVRLGIVFLGALEMSCGSAASGPSVPQGTGGKTVDTGTGGASTGSGGAAPTGSGGDAPTGSGGDTPTGSGGAAPTGSGGTAPTGSGGGAAPGGSGGAGSGGMGGTSVPSGDIWGGLKNPPRKSAGCDKPATLTNGKKTITSGGMPREYVIDIPANYDPATPYRLLYVGHGIPGMASDVPPGWWAWKSVATAANVPAIWIAPGALNGVRGAWSTADNRDHVLFDDILAAAEAGLCVDTTRVFAMGMSGGGMLTNALTSDRQNKIRAGLAMAPTNFNIWLPSAPLKDPVAWMQTTGMSDPICSWVANEAQMRGSKFIGLAKAANNGCTPAEIPTWKSGPHVCYDFAGCKPGYPTKVCTFNGPHTHISTDPGSNVNWIAKEGWAFLMQF